jgi:hypothetical protein
MIVKVHARGAGGGRGPTGYLLGRDGKRELAKTLRGDPDEVRELIDSLKFARKYTSGVLSFEEADLSPRQKDEIMDGFESVLLPGLDHDQYSVLWVEHRDKGRLELNFVIPNVELVSGKRLQPYYHAADCRRVNAWAETVRYDHALADPNDPARRRALTTPNDLPRDKQEAARAITDGLLAFAENGSIRNRDDVVKTLTEAGFNVVRQTKGSISIQDPSGGQNLRLKGTLYERDFKFSEGIRSELEGASKQYQRESFERVTRARADLERGIEIKRAALNERYAREPAKAKEHGVKHMEMAVVIDTSRTLSRDDRAFSDWVYGIEQYRENSSATPNIEAVERQRDRASESEAREWESADVFSFKQRPDVREPVQEQSWAASGRGEEVSDDEQRRASVIERIRELAERARATREKLAKRAREASEKLAGDAGAAAQRFYDNCKSLITPARSLSETERQLNESGRELEQVCSGFTQKVEDISAVQFRREVYKEHSIKRGFSLGGRSSSNDYDMGM